MGNGNQDKQWEAAFSRSRDGLCVGYAKGEFTYLAIHPLHAIRSGLLPLHHRDPFDRLLAAQSLELGVPLISADEIFDRYGVERIW